MRRYTRALGAAPCSSPRRDRCARAVSLAGHGVGGRPASVPARRRARRRPRAEPRARGDADRARRRATGSLVRRRAMLSREGIIGITLRAVVLPAPRGPMTLTATTAAGRQAYAVADVPDGEALRVCDAADPRAARRVPRALEAEHRHEALLVLALDAGDDLDVLGQRRAAQLRRRAPRRPGRSRRCSTSRSRRGSPSRRPPRSSPRRSRRPRSSGCRGGRPRTRRASGPCAMSSASATRTIAPSIGERVALASGAR